MKEIIKTVSSDKSETMRWGIERRMEFIEFLLYWEGRFNRKDITQYFGISTPQASADIRRYGELAPGNMLYDKSLKCYLVGDDFQLRMMTPDAEQYLSRLLENKKETTQLFYGQGIEFDTIPHFQRLVDHTILRKILAAIRNQHALEVEYQSLSKKNVKWRWITPHAFAYDQHRWHCRCYCHNSGLFKDFLLSRILFIKDNTKEHIINLEEDRAWQTWVDVKIGANPSFTKSQQRVIERDYGMKNGVMQVTVRLALLDYLLRQYRLNETLSSPEQQQIVLLNAQELEQIKKTIG